MKVLAFAASSSKKSINKQLVIYAASLLSDAEVEILDINDYEMPLYSMDREQESGIPDAAHKFREKIGQADALLISFAEHNASYTAAFKSLYDWTSRIDPKVYQGKPAVYLAASPGPGGASNVLNTAVTSAPYFGADLKGSLSIPKFFDNFDVENGKLSDETLLAELKSILNALPSS
ncbi:MAG: NAD(P)H-dependent oxidoreductase [Agarilytica sp.]